MYVKPVWTQNERSCATPSSWCSTGTWFYRIFEPPYNKTNKMTLHSVKTQISLGICLVWSESSLCTQWVAKGPSFHHADSKDSDQTGRMSMLIWVFAGRTCHFVGFVMRWLIYTYTIYAYFAPDPFLRSYFNECQKMKFIFYIYIYFYIIICEVLM